ncbi:MAG: HAMP domain-containing histidine kinase [Anaerolineae bacterium]|nr:HAMP domain-containing histidine kinase [Anaerolineae bacterium]
MITAVNRERTLANPYSIRWRLLLTYAGIALLAAVALGGLLLFTLRNYYDQREREYMNVSAEVISPSVEQMLLDKAPEETLQSATNILAFVALARVRLLTVDHAVIADSGPIDAENTINMEYRRPQGATSSDAYVDEVARPDNEPGAPKWLILDESETEYETYLSIRRKDFPDPDRDPARQFPMWTRRDALDQLLTGEATTESHTDIVVTMPLFNRQTNEIIGYLEVSEGPTFGTEIVRDVAEKAVVAGVIAVLLAAVVGWFTSSHISQPVLALSETTARMAEGDLSVRANMDRWDELGLLAHTFNIMAEQVENTVLTLKRFVADAAHEINTPITALRTNLELAATSDNPDEFRADIAHAQTELTRLEMLTHGLLTLARIEARTTGSPTTDKRVFELTALMRQMHERYASRAEQANITLELEMPPDTIAIEADEALIMHVLENLLDNAFKFTPENGTITLGLQTIEDQVRLWVTDTGIGIPADDVPKLFSRFYRASNASAYPGNGLGLVITKAIVEKHGGTITVASTATGLEKSAAHRTRFEVLLPYRGAT